MLKLFCFLKEIHNFGSQGRTGLGRNAVVYILLYGLIYFFYCANQLEDFFFFRCQFGFIHPFFVVVPSYVSVVVLSIGDQRISPFGA